jgi:hypothetical protein
MTAAGTNTGETGSTSAPARFTLTEDGKWTLSCSGAATGTARRVGQRLILSDLPEREVIVIHRGQRHAPRSILPRGTSVGRARARTGRSTWLATGPGIPPPSGVPPTIFLRGGYRPLAGPGRR